MLLVHTQMQTTYTTHHVLGSLVATSIQQPIVGMVLRQTIVLILIIFLGALCQNTRLQLKMWSMSYLTIIKAHHMIHMESMVIPHYVVPLDQLASTVTTSYHAYRFVHTHRKKFVLLNGLPTVQIHLMHLCHSM